MKIGMKELIPNSSKVVVVVWGREKRKECSVLSAHVKYSKGRAGQYPYGRSACSQRRTDANERRRERAVAPRRRGQRVIDAVVGDFVAVFVHKSLPQGKVLCRRDARQRRPTERREVTGGVVRPPSTAVWER